MFPYTLRSRALPVAALLLALPAALLSQRVPSGLAVTGTAASATITWQPVVGGVSYSVKRWKQDDLRCCNNASSSLGKPTWTDYGVNEVGFTQAGTYVFEVTVFMEDRTTAAASVNWTRPEAAPVISAPTLTVKTVQTVSLAAPTGVTVRNDPAALVFSWQPVSGATGYQIDAAPAPEGPWTPLVPAPINSTQFVYTPASGTLTYYRVSAALSLAASANGTIVPFIYNAPLNPLGVSAAQSGANVKVSWNPAPNATAYEVVASGTLLPVGGAISPTQLKVGAVTTATFVGLVSREALLTFQVIAHFPPQGTLGAQLSTRALGLGSLIVYTPSVCWPPAGELPGSPGMALPAPVATGGNVKLAWPQSGQVFAYRVDRAPAGSAQWESVACLKPGAYDFITTSRATSGITEFIDRSIALQPSTSYQYRVTALGPADATGKRTTTESIAMATTVPLLNLVVAARASSAASTTPWVELTWLTPAAGAVRDYMITSDFGMRRNTLETGLPFRTGSPRGTHTFSVTPLYLNSVPAATTTVTVVVP